MSLIFQCDGTDITGISALRSRLDNLTHVSQNPLKAMSEAIPSVIRVWVGPNVPSDAKAWIVEAQNLPVGERLLSDYPSVILLALINTPSGLAPEMHVVHERSRTPVYFQSRSELEGYFAERLASIQEVE